jgi:hypothetical protein
MRSEGLWIAALLRPPASGTPNHAPIEQRAIGSAHMAHRHYGLPAAKPHPTYAVNRAAAWSGGAIVCGIIAVVIVLVFILHETKIVIHTGDTTSGSF